MNQKLDNARKQFQWQRRIAFAAFVVIAVLMIVKNANHEEPGSGEIIIFLLSVLFGSQAAQGLQMVGLISERKGASDVE